MGTLLYRSHALRAFELRLNEFLKRRKNIEPMAVTSAVGWDVNCVAVVENAVLRCVFDYQSSLLGILLRLVGSIEPNFSQIFDFAARAGVVQETFAHVAFLGISLTPIAFAGP